MKKIILFTLFLLLIFPLVSAVDIEMNSMFDSGETLYAKISGNFLQVPTEDNLLFYRGHVNIPIISGIQRVGDDYYVYALLTGKQAGNYSLALENIKYKQGLITSEEDVSQEFVITENTADFSVNPGFIVTYESGSFEIQNIQSSSIQISFNFLENIIIQDSVTLASGEIKEIEFELENPKMIDYIEISSENSFYSFPIFVLNGTEVEEEEEEINFAFEPGLVEVSMATESETGIIIYLLNTGTETIENITFSVSSILAPYIEISPETIVELDADDNEKIEIDVISDIVPGTIEGTILAKSGSISKSLTLILDFVEDYIPTNGGEQIIVTTCAGLEGTFCEDDFECDGETIEAKDGICCIGTCEEVKKSSRGKIIGWSIIIVLILFIAWFFKRRYKGVGRREKKGINLFGRKR